MLIGEALVHGLASRKSVDSDPKGVGMWKWWLLKKQANLGHLCDI